ncbi:hypothetical protein DL95DRAFT_419269 [Leptodontidium sp. 2 PMI_412]|nr:hypothetical protein DL95DRAFT_419269 [Leptodontidium sp. 2 PMI_412]
MALSMDCESLSVCGKYWEPKLCLRMLYASKRDQTCNSGFRVSGMGCLPLWGLASRAGGSGNRNLLWYDFGRHDWGYNCRYLDYILVLPMVALRSDMLRRFHEVGIRPLVWSVDRRRYVDDPRPFEDDLLSDNTGLRITSNGGHLTSTGPLDPRPEFFNRRPSDFERSVTDF